MNPWIRLLIYLVAAPIVGGILAGWDRRISARMQSRQGPPILQPFYDVFTLFQTQNPGVRRSQNLYVVFLALPGVFIGFVFTLLIKFRKSPFDFSSSHHAHQEVVGGITTEFSGRTLALIEIAHWYETVFLLGLVYLFFGSMPWLGVAVSLLVFVLLVFVDNICARLKWQS